MRPTITIPKALEKGDTIALASPASHSAHPQRIGLATGYLESKGFRVRHASHLNRIDTDPATADSEKLADLHELFRDPEVHAIVCLRGGAGSSRLLSQLDYSLIAANPKILVGYSDITALSLGIFATTGLVGFSGPMAATELWEPSPYTEEHFWGMLIDPDYSKEMLNNALQHTKCIRPGREEGPLIGGNLSVLASMVGTPYMPDLDGAILFLEDVNEPAYRIDRMLSHLANAGLLKGCKGMLLGDFSGKTAATQQEETRLEGIFAYYSRAMLTGGPVMRGLSYGHIHELMTIPIGQTFSFEVAPDGSFSLQASAPVVQLS